MFFKTGLSCVVLELSIEQAGLFYLLPQRSSYLYLPTVEIKGLKACTITPGLGQLFLSIWFNTISSCAVKQNPRTKTESSEQALIFPTAPGAHILLFLCI